MPQAFRVLCASSERWLSLAHVPWLFHRAGAHVTFLGPAGAWALRGGFVDAWARADGGAPDVARALGRHLSRAATRAADYDWIVIGDDALLAAVAAHRAAPWAKAALPIAPDDVRVGLLGSKVGFVRAATALRLPVPASRVCLGIDEARAALADVGVPALMKEEGPSGGAGCRLIPDVASLASLPSSLWSAPLVVQAFVPGPTIAVEAVFDRGHLRHAVTSTVLRAWPAPFGISTSRRFAHDPAVVDLAREVGRTVGVHGFANITVMRDRADGRPLLVELDPRPNALFHLGDALGVPVSVTLRDILQGNANGPLRRLHGGVDVVVPIYPADVIRSAVERDWQGVAAWALNLDGRWRWARNADPRLARAYRRHIVRQVARATWPGRLREHAQAWLAARRR